MTFGNKPTGRLIMKRPTVAEGFDSETVNRDRATVPAHGIATGVSR